MIFPKVTKVDQKEQNNSEEGFLEHLKGFLEEGFLKLFMYDIFKSYNEIPGTKEKGKQKTFDSKNLHF